VEPVVIVGTGLAGYAVAKELRKLTLDGRVVLLTRDSGAWYSKPMLSNALAAGKTPDTLAAAGAAQLSQQLSIEVRTRLEVRRIVPQRHELETSAGPMRYSSLVLALGADPVPLAICDGLPNAYAVNDLDDYGRFRSAIDGARRIAILGGGLIGCEFANDLVSSGYAVTVIEAGEWPLGRLVPQAVGRALQDALSDAGVAWRLGALAERAGVTSGATRLHLSDGTVVEADVILSAVGLRPRIDLARTAGLNIERAITTNLFLETSEAGIYALGDCAQVNGCHLPYVLPLMHCARALAKTLAGERTRVTYQAMPIVVKTPVLPMTVISPETGVHGKWHIEASGRDVAATYSNLNGELAGFALTGAANGRKAALVRKMAENRDCNRASSGEDLTLIATSRS
jgi:rubredoxin-NAD+ reductase